MEALHLQRSNGGRTGGFYCHFTDWGQHVKEVSQFCVLKYAYIREYHLPARSRVYFTLKHIKFQWVPFLCLEIYHSWRIHFSSEIHSGIYLAFKLCGFDMDPLKLLCFRWVINQKTRVRGAVRTVSQDIRQYISHLYWVWSLQLMW